LCSVAPLERWVRLNCDSISNIRRRRIVRDWCASYLSTSYEL